MASLSHVTQLLALIGLLSGGVRTQMLYGNMMMPGAFMGGGMGFSPFIGGFDFDDFDDDDDDFDSLRLSCMNNVTDARTGQVSDAIAVTISYGLGGSGFGRNGFGGSGFGGFGHDPYGYYGFNGGMGNNNNGGPLKAEIQVLSSGIGVASVVVTERARVEDGCHQETLGAIYSPRPRNSNFQNNMYSGYGHMGLGAGMGLFDDDFGLSNGNGIIKNDIKINVNLQTIYIDAMNGFDNLADLAGRGIAVCADSSYGWDWEATCEGPIYMCCALKYDNHGQQINIHDYRGSHVTYA